ncbi:hypothetical protein AX17_005509 [Amanita inopinata Kibby_2008]|nr:hypothetical protein AX17_005509 [Amanita inopinata Kibby_2008]
MRFRAFVDDVQTSFIDREKLQKKCIVKNICTLYAIARPTKEVSKSGLEVDMIVSTYRIQFNSENTITLTHSPEALLAALRLKNVQAVLSFEIMELSHAGLRMRLTQDVRIEVMKRMEVEKLEELRVCEPDVHILLPPLNKLRTIVERLQPMANMLEQ